MKRVLLLSLALVTTVAQAAASDSNLDCEVIKREASIKGEQASAAPNMAGLKNAALLYAASPSAAACIYPDVSVRNLPVGEYESANDSPPFAITLTNRVEYSWGAYRLQRAVLSVPVGLSASTTVLPSGQVVIEAAATDR